MQRNALIENVQREDLNPIEVAKSLKQMIDDQGLKQDLRMCQIPLTE